MADADEKAMAAAQALRAAIAATPESQALLRELLVLEIARVRDEVLPVIYAVRIRPNLTKSQRNEYTALLTILRVDMDRAMRAISDRNPIEVGLLLQTLKQQPSLSITGLIGS